MSRKTETVEATPVAVVLLSQRGDLPIGRVTRLSATDAEAAIASGEARLATPDDLRISFGA